MVIFGINFPQRGISPCHFYKILPGEGAPRPHSHAKFHRCSFKKVAVRLKKIVLQDLLVPAVVLFADMTGHCWPASVNCCVDAY